MSEPRSFNDALRAALKPRPTRAQAEARDLESAIIRLKAMLNLTSEELENYLEKLRLVASNSDQTLGSLVSVSNVLASTGLSLDAIYLSLLKRNP